VHGTPIRITDRRVATVGENINWVRLILQLRTIGGGSGAPEEVPTRENNNFYQLQFYLYVDTIATSVTSSCPTLSPGTPDRAEGLGF
jgi:hypothetical protein